MASVTPEHVLDAQSIRRKSEDLHVFSCVEVMPVCKTFQRHKQALQLGSNKPNVTATTSVLLEALSCTFVDLFINHVKLKADRVDSDEAVDEVKTHPADAHSMTPFWYKLLTCDMCDGYFADPVTIPCGHTFCRTCITSDSSSECFSCGAKDSDLRTSSMQSNVLLCNIREMFIPNQNEAVKLRLRGDRYMEELQYQDAVDMFSKAVQLVPTDFGLIMRRCQAKARAGRYVEALLDVYTMNKQRLDKTKAVQVQILRNEMYAAFDIMVERLNHLMSSSDEAVQVQRARNKIYGIIDGMTESLMSSSDKKCSDEKCSGNEVENDAQMRDSRNLIRVEQLECLPEERKLETAPQKESLHVASNMASIENTSSQVPAESLYCASIADHFECSLCYRLLYQPVTTPCGHVFCRQCLNRSLDHRSSCPLCKSSLSEYLSQRRQAVTTVIVQLMRAYLPDEYSDREKLNQEEINALNKEDFAEYGCMLTVNDVSFLPDGRSIVDSVGGQRFKVVHRGMLDGYHTAQVEYIDDDDIADSEYQETQRLQTDVYQASVKLFSALSWSSQRQIIGNYGEMPANTPVIARGPGVSNGPPSLWWIAAILPLNADTKVRMLRMRSLQERLNVLNEIVTEITNHNTR